LVYLKAWSITLIFLLHMIEIIKNPMRAALLAMMLTFGSQAGADVFDTDFKLRKLASIGVSLYDGATGACWTNLKEVREYAEEKLSMKGAKIDNEAYVSLEANRYNFDIEVIG